MALLDVAPTLLDAAGVQRPQTFAGRSLLPALGGAPEPGEPAVVGEQLWGPRETLLRTPRWAWIQKASGLELYDLVADPHEHRDLARTEPERAAEGAQRIEEFRRECARRAKSLGAGAAEPAPISPEREKALRALGYVH